MKFINLIESINENELPMDDQSRMDRAKQMGFDTSIVYHHGSPDARNIRSQGFQPGFHNDGGFLYFTPSYRVANSYADDTRAFDYQNAEPEVLKVFLRFKNPAKINWGGKNFRYQDLEGKSHNVGDHIAQAKAQGHDAVIVRNIADEYGGNGKNYHGKPDTIVVVFDPTQIRSVDAVFDPSQSNNPSIVV